jgi:hypothetical protein
VSEMLSVQNVSYVPGPYLHTAPTPLPPSPPGGWPKALILDGMTFITCSRPLKAKGYGS